MVSPEHHLAITTNTVVERLSGHTEDFDILEKTSHLKQGVEIPLMVLGSMPDFLRSYYEWREKHKPLTEAKKLIASTAVNMIEGPNKHYLQLSVGVEGKRAEHMVKVGTAIQTHQAVKEEGRLGKLWSRITGRDEE